MRPVQIPVCTVSLWYNAYHGSLEKGARRTIVRRELPAVKGKNNPRMEEVNYGYAKIAFLADGKDVEVKRSGFDDEAVKR